MNFTGWAIFMDCDMLCQDDIAELWNQRDEIYSVMCVKHNHEPKNKTKFLGEPQSSYPKKNWSSLMLMNCKKCKKLLRCRNDGFRRSIVYIIHVWINRKA